MKTGRLTFLILVLAFLGLADSWYLADSALSHKTPTCDVAVFSDCAEVAQSPYAKPLGIPLGVYGAAFSASIFMLAALALVLKERPLYSGMFALSVLGAIGSLGLLIIQAAVIDAFCIYCLLFELISFLLLIATWKLYRRTRPVTLPGA